MDAQKVKFLDGWVWKTSERRSDHAFYGPWESSLSGWCICVCRWVGAERERLFSHTYMRNLSPLSQTRQQPSLWDLLSHTLSFKSTTQQGNHEWMLLYMPNSMTNPSPWLWMSVRERLREQAAPFNPSKTTEKWERTLVGRESQWKVYIQSSNTHSQTHTHTYNTPPHSLGSQGHIPPPQSASGFHTLGRGCGCVTMDVPVCVCVWDVLVICGGSGFRARRGDGRKIGEK